jgi:hypothetical protein
MRTADEVNLVGRVELKQQVVRERSWHCLSQGPLPHLLHYVAAEKVTSTART